MGELTHAERAAIALASAVDPTQHGQLCPIWAQRRKEPEVTRCDCWILPRARRDADVALAAARPHIEAEALEREADELHKPHHALHDEQAHEDERECVGCEWYARLRFRAHQIRVGGSDAP